MSHFKQYQGDAAGAEGRNLGDEWLDWSGKDDGPIKAGRSLFLLVASAFFLAASSALLLLVYLITPRLALWNPALPSAAWTVAAIIIAVFALWLVQFVSTVFTGRRVLWSPMWLAPLFNLTFAGAFRLAQFFGVSRDRLGHSFVKVSNSLSRALKPKGRRENLLLLLPRCLTKEQLKEINALKDIYPITIHTVSGGELARKKVKEIRPTAVIGVACERDLVSGIRDVGTRFSVIGITNERPDGPCKNTFIDMKELIDSIEFFVGPPKPADGGS